jgi:hypothetical protein
MIAMSPVTKAEIPETIPESIVSARAGLTAMSFNMVPPAGTDSYNKVVKDMPMKNNTGIAAASPSDHLPSVVFGIKLNLIKFYSNKKPPDWRLIKIA